jgi:hypothetical protein
MNDKLKVWLLDDKEDHAEAFVKEMEQYFDIRTFVSFVKLEDALDFDRPDVVLLDLYYPEGDFLKREEIDFAIKNFNDAIDVLKKNLPLVLKPQGVYYLNELRDDYSAYELPILIYTRAGQYALSELEVQNILDLHSHFILKRFNPDVKRALITRHVRRWKLSIDVFISYATVDIRIAEEIESLLKQRRDGLKIFLAEKNLSSGDDWNAVIRQSLKLAKVVVPLLTRASIRSQWVMAEAGACWALEKPICAGTLGIGNSRVPSLIKGYQYRSIETQEQKIQFVDSIINRVSGSIKERKGFVGG